MYFSKESVKLRGSISPQSLSVFFLEALNAACRIDELLFAGKERMAVIANFNAERILRGG